MGKRFRKDHLNQSLLMPPSLQDWLPQSHLARFMADVTEELDLGTIYRSYEKDGRGKAAYQPLMMLRILLFGYCRGVARSSKPPTKTWRSGFCQRVSIWIMTRSRRFGNATSKRWPGCLFKYCSSVRKRGWSNSDTWPSTERRSKPTPASIKR